MQERQILTNNSVELQVYAGLEDREFGDKEEADDGQDSCQGGRSEKHVQLAHSVERR